MNHKYDLKILFIARNYPPVIGGLEKNAEDFYQNVSKLADLDLLANPLGKKHLPAFILKVIFFLIINANKYDVIHFNDAVLSPVIPIIKAFSKAKVTFTVNGLDIVFSNFFYQVITPFFLRRADKIFPISAYTKRESERRRVDPNKMQIITVGINLSEQYKMEGVSHEDFLSKHSINIRERKVLVSIGRLVARKGHAWFIENVFPNLPNDFIYLIAGDGPERQKLLNLIHERGLAERIHAIGRVAEEEKQIMFQIADLFIMPNISIKNDPEGFGIVLLEAGSYNVPVIATDIEGISSAVLEGVTGRLVPEKDVNRFIRAITNPDIDRTKIKTAIEVNFNWENIAKKYLREFELLTTP